MDDLISREEAIKAVKFYETFCDPYPRVIEALEELPSVHLELSNNSPKLDKEIGECNDCIKHDGDWECDRVHCHKGDAISRQATIEVLKDEWVGVPVYYLCGEDIFEYSKFRIESLPPVQPRKGKWIKIMKTNESETATFYTPTWICGDCKTEYDGAIANSIIKFCYNCGADMRGEQDE